MELLIIKFNNHSLVMIGIREYDLLRKKREKCKNLTCLLKFITCSASVQMYRQK